MTVSDPAPSVSALVAHKFGGSSLADAGRICAVVDLLRAQGEPAQVVIASAKRGVTDALIALADWAQERRDSRLDGPDHQFAESALDTLYDQHWASVQIVDPDGRQGLARWFTAEFAALRAGLAALASGRGRPEAVHGLGEVWCSRLLHAALGGEVAGWAWLDAREVLVVDDGELGAVVDWQRTRERLTAWRAAHERRNVVVPGFVAADAQGRPTTLGRNGSDYSGALFAVLFEAALLNIWTDVDGVLSADPRLVPDAICLPALSYEEACELAYFGAKVIHPQTLAPAMACRLPIRIRNSFWPAHPGTVIGPETAPAEGPVKGLSLVPHLAVLELTGAGMIGVPGTAERLFAALHDAGVSVVMITQGSSEHSICCVLRQNQSATAEDAVRAAFAAEIAGGQIQGVAIADGISVLAAVGDGMVGRPGVAARLFGGLARAQVNVRAIAQGASERNISVAIASADATRGLRAAHAAFWLSPQTLSIGLIGPGKVGRALLAQLAEAMPRLLREANLDLRVRAVAASRRMRLAARAFATEDLADVLAGEVVETTNLDRFERHVHADHLPHAVIVDCSASAQVAALYRGWLTAGIHVVTANKQAGSGPWPQHQALRAAQGSSGARFHYEATVGAGLPVIQTLRRLLDTGDELYAIEGMLSGTLTWLCHRHDGSRPFSALVREAYALGYTEPDPRHDLGGLDVARKLVILAREAGWPLSLEQVEVESLVPAPLRTVDQGTFSARLEELDAPLAERLAEARRERGHLRYVAELDREGRARVGLRVLPGDHACVHTRLTDNLVQLRTRRYADNPLVVQGPGAGPEVTAAGVFGDLLQLARSLGARL